MNQKKKCIKVYVSGPITGLTEQEAESNFHCSSIKIEAYFREQGYNQIAIFNPMQKPGSFYGVSYTDCMEIDFMYINKCDAIYLMDGWQKSKGAMMEALYADFMGKRLFTENEKHIEDPLDLDDKDPYEIVEIGIPKPMISHTYRIHN